MYALRPVCHGRNEMLYPITSFCLVIADVQSYHVIRESLLALRARSGTAFGNKWSISLTTNDTRALDECLRRLRRQRQALLVRNKMETMSL